MELQHHSRYRLELRSYGIVLKRFDCEGQREALDMAQQWLNETKNATVLLWVDGTEIKQPQIPTALGCRKNSDFDSLDRYDRHPLPFHSHNKRLVRKGKWTWYKV